MHKLISYFNQNRKLILVILIIILAVFIGLRLINHFVRLQNEERMKNMSQKSDTNIGMEDRNYEIAGGEIREKEIYQDEKLVIDTFLINCNNKKFEEAYSMLTQECKETMFPDINTFIKEYGEKIFNTQKDYNIQAWSSNIYRIKLMENLLTNGKTSDEDYIEQYYTVQGEQLNIDNYIGTSKFNKTQEKANVEINVEKIDFYIDYAIAKINIVNNRETSIMLNTRDYADNIYLSDEQELIYAAVLNEIEDEEFIISPGVAKDISIQFSIPYNKAEEVVSLNINNMIANYEQYEEIGDSRVIQFNIEF